MWNPSTPRVPPKEAGWVYKPAADWESRPTLSEEQEPGKLTHVDIYEFLATLWFWAIATYCRYWGGRLPFRH